MILQVLGLHLAGLLPDNEKIIYGVTTNRSWCNCFDLEQIFKVFAKFANDSLQKDVGYGEVWI